MAQTQKTIRFNKETDRLIAEISPSGDINYNFAVNQAMHRYQILCKHLTPNFPYNEWNAICECYNGHLFNADIELEALAFPRRIRESIAYDENVRCLLDSSAQTGNPLRTNFPEFLAKIDALSVPQIIAVFSVVNTFWTPSTNFETTETEAEAIE
jgi:hypothetical protein